MSDKVQGAAPRRLQMAEGKIGCPECAPGAKDPHDEPDQNHIHLTPYGYLIYAPDHEMRDWIEEIRAEGYARGRHTAASDILARLAVVLRYVEEERLT